MNMKLTLIAISVALVSQVTLASPSENTINSCENLDKFVNNTNNLKNPRSSQEKVKRSAKLELLSEMNKLPNCPVKFKDIWPD